MAQYLNSYTGVGRVTGIEYKETKSGNMMCTVKVAVNWSRKEDGEWKEYTNWFDLTAWGGGEYDRAKKWSESFAKGDVVWVSGQLQPRAYKSEKTGELGIGITLANPTIDKVPGSAKKSDAGEPIPAKDAADANEMPF